LLNVGAEGPVLVSGVQHAVHPPEHLDSWPDEDRRSRIVFIGRGFDGGELERSLAVFNRLSEGDGATRSASGRHMVGPQ
jgi:G3E family GTPase